MAITRPTVFPRWTYQADGSATPYNVTDPTSLKANVVEPTSGKKTTGFLYREFPPRQDFNWLQRYNGTWIEFLNQQEITHAAELAAQAAKIDSLVESIPMESVSGFAPSANASTFLVNAGGMFRGMNQDGTEVVFGTLPPTFNAGVRRTTFLKVVSGIGFVAGYGGNPIPSAMTAPADDSFLQAFFVLADFGGTSFVGDIAFDSDLYGANILASVEFGTVKALVRISGVRVLSWAAKTLHRIDWSVGCSLYYTPIVKTIVAADFSAEGAEWAAVVGLDDCLPIWSPSASPILSFGAPSAGNCIGSAATTNGPVSAQTLYANGVFNVSNHATYGKYGSALAEHIQRAESGVAAAVILDSVPVGMTMKMIVHGWRESTAFGR